MIAIWRRTLFQLPVPPPSCRALGDQNPWVLVKRLSIRLRSLTIDVRISQHAWGLPHATRAPAAIIRPPFSDSSRRMCVPARAASWPPPAGFRKRIGYAALNRPGEWDWQYLKYSELWKNVAIVWSITPILKYDNYDKYFEIGWNIKETLNRA